MLKCTINGQTTEVPAGTTIIEAMVKMGQRIAHYCWHPGLSVAGVCRLCMVEIEGNPRLQIACNTQVTEGMVVNNFSPKVKDAVKWGLDFHLINHPLDCPICDQAGECGLQDQYMEYGKYDPEMAERKVKKKKVVDLGPTVVLDSERCILCARCVRFTNEVTQTNELGIFNRGDRSEIGTVDGKKLDNKYSLNTVDICPVGALTSKDFRFKQRAWYLKDAPSVCNGCSAGCNINVYFNREGLFRVKPKFNEKVNGYWMCDEGRDLYKHVNKEYRLTKTAKVTEKGREELVPGASLRDLSKLIKKYSANEIALIMTGQYTQEENTALVSYFVNTLNSKNVFHWVNNRDSFESFDGVLLRGDRNPNTVGLVKILEQHSLQKPWAELEAGLKNRSIKMVLVAGPENQTHFPELAAVVDMASAAETVIWLTVNPLMGSGINGCGKGKELYEIPVKSFVEKDGTFINYAGIEQSFKKVTTVVSEALSIVDVVALLSEKAVSVRAESAVYIESNRRADQVMLEHRKKNEAVFKRGAL